MHVLSGGHLRCVVIGDPPIHPRTPGTDAGIETVWCGAAREYHSLTLTEREAGGKVLQTKTLC